VLVNISAIACGWTRDAGHDVVAALTVPFRIRLIGDAQSTIPPIANHC
jgi:hypothetical protein